MEDDIFVYRVKLPAKHREAVMACCGGYTVYIDESLDYDQALKAYLHAVEHIRRGDCDHHGDVQETEKRAHYK